MQHAFHSLSNRRQVRCLSGLARNALGAYPVRGARLRLLAHFWNTTFRATVPEGDQYVLRVHHRGQTSIEAVRSELLWLAALQKDGFSVPEPVLNEEQSLVTVATHPGVPEPRLCVLFRWVEGRFLYQGLTPSHLAQAGELMARLHLHAAQWTRPREFARHRVEKLDPMEREHDEDRDPAVAQSVSQLVASVCTPEAGRVLAAVIPKIWKALAALGEGPDAFGLIHADMHHRNLLFGKAGIGAIDFDDCGYGHWLYEMAVPLTELERHPAYPALRRALFDGYRRRRALSVDPEAQLETFIALRRVQNVLGVIKERNHPGFRDWWKENVEYELARLRDFTNR